VNQSTWRPHVAVSLQALSARTGSGLSDPPRLGFAIDFLISSTVQRCSDDYSFGSLDALPPGARRLRGDGLFGQIMARLPSAQPARPLPSQARLSRLL
jgi:hypothetical protein